MNYRLTNDLDNVARIIYMYLFYPGSMESLRQTLIPAISPFANVCTPRTREEMPTIPRLESTVGFRAVANVHGLGHSSLEITFRRAFPLVVLPDRLQCLHDSPVGSLEPYRTTPLRS